MTISEQFDEIFALIRTLKAANVLTEDIANEFNNRLDDLKDELKEPEPIVIESNKNEVAWRILYKLCLILELEKTKKYTDELVVQIDELPLDIENEWYNYFFKELNEKTDIVVANKIANKTWVRYIPIALFSWLLGVICMA